MKIKTSHPITFRAYFLWLEVGALALTAVILLIGIRITLEGASRIYLDLRRSDVDQVHLFFNNQLDQARRDLDAFATMSEAERLTVAPNLFMNYSDIYRLDAQFRVEYIYKATPGNRVFEGFSFTGGKLGRYLGSAEMGTMFSSIMPGYEDDDPGIYYACRQGDSVYLGRMNLMSIREFMAQSAQFSGTPLMLISQDGFVMVSSDPDINLYSLDLKTWADAPAASRTLVAGRQRWMPMIVDESAVGAKVVVLIPTDLRDALQRMLGVFFFAFLGGLAILSVMKNRQIERFVLEPISSLTYKLADLESGRPPVAGEDANYRFDELVNIHVRFQAMAQAIAAREHSLKASEEHANEMARRIEAAHQVLRESEERFRLAFENANIGVCLVGLDGQILKVNQRLCDMLGYTAQELEQMTVNNTSHPDSLEASPAFIRQAVAGQVEHSEFEKKYIHKQGQTVWGQVSSSIVRDSLGRPLYFISHVHDVTEQRRIENIIQLRLDLLEFSVNHSLDDLMQHALNKIEEVTTSSISFYHFVEADQKTLSLQAWSTRTLQEFCKAEGKGLHYSIDQAGVWVDCVHQRKPVIHNDYVALPHRKGMPAGHAEVKREMVAPTLRAGRIVSILGVGNKPFDYDGKDAELVAYVADVVWAIIERKQAEAQLQDYQRQLEAQNLELHRLMDQARQDAEIKARLLQEVNHRVKNNLAAIVGLLYAERQHIRQAGVQAYESGLQDLIRRVEGLSTVHHLLSASQWSPLPLDDLTRQIIESCLQAVPPAKRVKVSVVCLPCPPNSPSSLRVVADQAHSIALIVNELATNTLKYALPYQDVVRINVHITTEDNGEMVVFEYRDDGPGYPQEVLPFECHNIGLDLIYNITRSNLSGVASLRNEGGAVTTLRFRTAAITTSPQKAYRQM